MGACLLPDAEITTISWISERPILSGASDSLAKSAGFFRNRIFPVSIAFPEPKTSGKRKFSVWIGVRFFWFWKKSSVFITVVSRKSSCIRKIILRLLCSKKVFLQKILKNKNSATRAKNWFFVEQVMVRLSNFYEVRWWDFCFAWG